MAAAGSYLVRIVAPHFVAEIVMEEMPSGRGRGFFCVRNAPILAWCRGRADAWLRAEFRRKGWQATIVSQAAP
jgi:hypothetical protein